MHRILAYPNGLTAREWEMVCLLANGHSNNAIAKRLGVTINTVKKTLTSSYGKLKVRNRVEATRKFLECEKAGYPVCNCI
jgi:DNA-binding CsgD family transcriptional regulator